MRCIIDSPAIKRLTAYCHFIFKSFFLFIQNLLFFYKGDWKHTYIHERISIKETKFLFFMTFCFDNQRITKKRKETAIKIGVVFQSIKISFVSINYMWSVTTQLSCKETRWSNKKLENILKKGGNTKIGRIIKDKKKNTSRDFEMKAVT